MSNIHKRFIPIIDSQLEIRESGEKDDVWLGFVVEFYIITWGNRNRHGEVFLKGSEARSIEALKNKEVKFFKNHEWSPPGVVVGLEADNIGLRQKVALINTTEGRNTLVEYKSGQITQHSIGFEFVQNGATYNEHDKTIYYTDFLMKEGSALNGWGSDKNTSVIAMNAEIEQDRKEILRSLGIIKPELTFNIEKLINNFNF